MNSIFLQSFSGTNKTIPVWFMRQAGRFLPEYRAIKEKYALGEMFRNPEVAAKITCLPIDILGVDAAILFADILTLPAAMGLDIEFLNNGGPSIKNPISREIDLKKIHDFENLEYIAETIKLVNQKLPKNIPLVGFAGSPFTVLCYLVEGGQSANFNKIFRLSADCPLLAHKLLKILTKNTVDYVNLQKKAGIKAFQLFDTWAGVLRPSDYAHFVLPYAKEIFAKVDLPSIYYVKNCAHLLGLLDQCGADFLSVDHTVVLGHNSVLAKTKKGIQGNLFNGLLYADFKTLKTEVNDVLLGAQHYKRYIFNLSHGILPDTDVEKAKFIVEQVHNFRWRP